MYRHHSWFNASDRSVNPFFQRNQFAAIHAAKCPRNGRKVSCCSTPASQGAGGDGGDGGRILARRLQQRFNGSLESFVAPAGALYEGALLFKRTQFQGFTENFLLTFAVIGHEYVHCWLSYQQSEIRVRFGPSIL